MEQRAEAVEDQTTGLIRGLSLLDSTMIVAGSMIGSGIFLVTADISRQVGSSGWLLMVWIVTGFLTVAGALSYGELAAMMPRAGGPYVYLREAFSPIFGFLYGWTFFLVIQCGGIAAVAIAFSVYLGQFVETISSTSWVVAPINLSSTYAVSLSSQQLIAILMILLLTYINIQGLRLGKIVQNIFTSTKTLALIALIGICILLSNPAAVADNFTDLWTPRGVSTISPDFGFVPSVSAASGLFGLFVAFTVAQVGSIFAADGWYYITFTAGEVKNPKRNIPLSLVFGTVLVISLYCLANIAYMTTLTMPEIQGAPDDRVATAALNVALGSAGAVIMAIAIMISTFGANNGIILAGARVFFTMARDGLFFKRVGQLNSKHVPGAALVLQCIWSCALVFPRTRLYDEDGAPLSDPLGNQLYGSLYSNLLDYVVFAIVIFFALTVLALFMLRWKRPDAERPYRAFGYPIVPAFYVIACTAIIVILMLYRTQTTWPGLIIVLTGIPVYLIWRRVGRPFVEGAERAG